MMPDDPKGSISSNQNDFSEAGIDELQFKADFQYLGLTLILDRAGFREKLEPFAHNSPFKDYLYGKLRSQETLVPSHIALDLLYWIEKHPTKIIENRPSYFVGLYFGSNSDGVFTPNPLQQGMMLAKFWKELFDHRDQGIAPTTFDLTKFEWWK